MLHVGIRSAADDVLLPEEQELSETDQYGRLDANVRQEGGALSV
tara:strand:+ start:274 stop:405 length:132 start_codon:yes stop_codon:yes gene_type:complete